MSITKCVGRLVIMIYQDKNDEITQRTIRVTEVDGNKVRAFDLNKKQPRVFYADRMLAIELVKSHAS